MIIRVGDPDPEPVAEAQLPADLEPAATEEPKQHAKQEASYTPRKKPHFTMEALQDELEKRSISLRLNDITAETVIEGVDASGTQYEEDSLLADLHSSLGGIYSGVTLNVLPLYLTVVAKKNRFNPVADYIRGIKWDGRSRFSDLVSLMGIEEDPLSQTLLYKWLLQGVALQHNNDSNNAFGAAGVLVLQGAQGTGKTSILRRLAMKSQWFGEGMAIKDYDKDTSRRVSTTFISELGEVETTFKSDVEGLKNFITQPLDVYRIPYGKLDIRKCRHTNLAATCNSDRYLIDTTGNRRWWTIPIKKRMEYKEIQKIDAEQLWAEIWQVAEECGDMSGCFRLTEEEEKLLAIRNGDAEKYLKSEAEILDILAEAERNPSCYEWRETTVTKFKEQYDPYLRQYSVEVIGKALARQGYKSTKKRVDGKQIRYISLPMKAIDRSGTIPFSRDHTQFKARPDTRQERLSDMD